MVGTHDIAIASALASISEYDNLGIIWFDAHGDYNTFETTSTGNIHGMPLSVITNYNKELLSSFHTGNFYSPKNAVLFGARDIDEPYEMNNLKKAGVNIITTSDIQKYGVVKMLEQAFKIALDGTNGIHISLDLDCIDPKLAPGVSVPSPNGLNLQEAYDFINYIINSKQNIKSIDLVEFNPLLDIDHKAEKIATHILNELINNL